MGNPAFEIIWMSSQAEHRESWARSSLGRLTRALDGVKEEVTVPGVTCLWEAHLSLSAAASIMAV